VYSILGAGVLFHSHIRNRRGKRMKMKWISFQKEIEIKCVKVPYFLFGGEWQKEVMREWERERESRYSI
jgi:hypothetical protein